MAIQLIKNPLILHKIIGDFKNKLQEHVLSNPIFDIEEGGMGELPILSMC